MNFDNLILYDLMTGLYRFILNFLLLILLLRHSQYLPYYVIEFVKEFKIHSVEAVRKVGQKSNVKFMTYVKPKTQSKNKAHLKKGEHLNNSP